MYTFINVLVNGHRHKHKDHPHPIIEKSRFADLPPHRKAVALALATL